MPGEATFSREGGARRYEAIHRRLFFVRLLIIAVLLLAYHQFGASARLADALHSRFGEAWVRVHLVYLALTCFGYWALLFPLGLYEGFTIEHRFGQSTQRFRDWFGDALKEYVVDLVLFLLFFSGLYALMRLMPGFWWLGATLFYVCGVVLLAFVAPVLLLPWFFSLEPLDDPDLEASISRLFEKAQIPVGGICRWGLGEKTRAANAALIGLGASRRILLSDTLLDGYTKDEIVAVVAHEVGHHRNGDILRLLTLSTALAALVFLLTSFAFNTWLLASGMPRPAHDIALFPVLCFLLLLFALPALPLLNLYSRQREYAADAYAVSTVGQAEPLVTVLQRMTEQNLVDPMPPPWVEVLLHSHPSIDRRIARARAAAPASEASP